MWQPAENSQTQTWLAVEIQAGAGRGKGGFRSFGLTLRACTVFHRARAASRSLCLIFISGSMQSCRVIPAVRARFPCSKAPPLVARRRALLRAADRPFRSRATTAAFSTAVLAQTGASRVATAAIGDAGTIRVTWADGTPPSTFSARWLWFNAPPHVDAGTGQRSLSSAALLSAPSARQARIREDRLAVSVEWSDGDAFSFDADWLKRHAFSDASLARDQDAAMPPSFAPVQAGGRLGTGALPTFAFDALMSSEDEVWRWLLALNEFGLTLVNGAPLDGGTVLRVAERISAPMHTIYGSAFDVVVEARPINLAYAPVGLELHCDLVYYVRASQLSGGLSLQTRPPHPPRPPPPIPHPARLRLFRRGHRTGVAPRPSAPSLPSL